MKNAIQKLFDILMNETLHYFCQHDIRTFFSPINYYQSIVEWMNYVGKLGEGGGFGMGAMKCPGNS
jgi:hypothetical protein